MRFFASLYCLLSQRKMNKISFFIIVLAAFFGAKSAVGQGTGAAIKVGHTNSGYILNQLPDTKKAQTELETVKKQLEKVIQDKSKVFEEKVGRYQAGGQSMSQSVRETTEAELQKLQTELRELQGKSETTFMEKQQSLFTPILEKVNKAIQEVGKEQGYMYILNGDTGSVGNPVLLYSGSEETDITNLVLKKLGVTAAK